MKLSPTSPLQHPNLNLLHGFKHFVPSHQSGANGELLHGVPKLSQPKVLRQLPERGWDPVRQRQGLLQVLGVHACILTGEITATTFPMRSSDCSGRTTISFASSCVSYPNLTRDRRRRRRSMIGPMSEGRRGGVRVSATTLMKMPPSHHQGRTVC